MKKVNKVVLAYSGGLDTSHHRAVAEARTTAIPRWSCYCANLGQADELTGLEEKA